MTFAVYLLTLIVVAFVGLYVGHAVFIYLHRRQCRKYDGPSKNRSNAAINDAATALRMAVSLRMDAERTIDEFRGVAQ